MAPDETARSGPGSPRPGHARLRRALRIAAFVVGGFVLAAGSNLAFGTGVSAQEDGSAEDDELIARGGQIFGTRCATCHGEEGRGIDPETSPSQFGPPIQDAGPAAFDFVIRTGRMPLDDPRQPMRRREPELSDEERRAVVAWSRTLPGDGPEIPDVGAWERADLARGLESFTTNCAACHGATAEGIAVGRRDFSSALDDASPVEIAEAIRIGPGVMPVFGEDAMPEEEMRSVVRWVMDLRDRAAPGGLTVGRTGPVAEGMVGWILGFGLLTVAMYLLGEKSRDEEEADDAGA